MATEKCTCPTTRRERFLDRDCPFHGDAEEQRRHEAARNARPSHSATITHLEDYRYRNSPDPHRDLIWAGWDPVPLWEYPDEWPENAICLFEKGARRGWLYRQGGPVSFSEVR